MVFEDIEKAAEAFAVAYEYMEWLWVDDAGASFRPRRDDISHQLLNMRESLLADNGQHDFIKAEGLMVDLTDLGTIVYRLEPDMEHVYRLAHAKCTGAKLECLDNGEIIDDFPWEG